MATDKHHDDPNRARAAGEPGYDARKDGTTRTATMADRPMEHDRATKSKSKIHDAEMDRAAHPAGTARTNDTVRADAARSDRTRTDRTHAERKATTGEHTKRSATQKGLWVGVLTFLALTLIDWLVGPTLSPLEALTFFDVVVYAVIGIVVGWATKAIDLKRHKHGDARQHA